MTLKSYSNSISTIMPAYNEETNIEKAVLQTQATLETLGLEYEIILVNDCSRDQTPEIIDRLAQTHPAIKAYHHPENIGIGGAFRTGIENAGKEHIIFVPADNPLLPEDMALYLPRMGICDIVVGLRIERVGYTRLMRFASFFYNRILIPLLFNIGLSDVNWIQIYKRHIFGPGRIEIEHNGIFFLVEILIKARRHHCIIAEVPTKMKKRMAGKATCARPSVMWQTFWDMWCFFLKIRKEDKQKK